MPQATAQRVILGAGSLRQLPDLLKGFSFKSLFLVTGHHSFSQPVIQAVIQPLEQACPVLRFSEFAKNPQIGDVERGVEKYRSLNSPLVLAIGGGSVLDMAKLVHYFGQTGESVPAFFAEKQAPRTERLPGGLIAVPTTAGTGSESTPFATLYIDQIKHSLDTPTIVPDIALVDPVLAYNLPPQVTAASGMDALTQAVESYWSIHATPESQALAASAIRLIIPNIEIAVKHGIPEARAAMAEGSNLAGQAIHLTRTTAPHAISYPMTAYFGVAHGQAVSISLPHFLLFNAGVTEEDVLDSRGADYVRKTLDEIVELLGCRSLEEARDEWLARMQLIGLKTTLSELGITRPDWETIIRYGFNPQRVRNNPRLLTEDHLRQLLAQFGG